MNTCTGPCAARAPFCHPAGLPRSGTRYTPSARARRVDTRTKRRLRRLRVKGVSMRVCRPPGGGGGGVFDQPAGPCPIFFQMDFGRGWRSKAAGHSQGTTEDRDRYASGEMEANARRIGLLRDADPVPPWELRHRGKLASALQRKRVLSESMWQASSSQEHTDDVRMPTTQ